MVFYGGRFALTEQERRNDTEEVGDKWEGKKASGSWGIQDWRYAGSTFVSRVGEDLM